MGKVHTVKYVKMLLTSVCNSLLKKVVVDKEEEEEADKKKTTVVDSGKWQCIIWHNTASVKMSAPHNMCTALKCSACRYTN